MDKETKDYIDSKFNELMSAIASACTAGKTQDEQPDPLANWNDTYIYPVWKDETKPHSLENLDGIHVPVIDGTDILLFPRYDEHPLLSEDKLKDWTAKEQRRNPIYADVRQEELTDELLRLGSKAAEFVRLFGKDLALPKQLLAVARYAEKINALSKLLGGDYLPSNFDRYWWSCLRHVAHHIWCASAGNGTFNHCSVYCRCICLPVSLYEGNCFLNH